MKQVQTETHLTHLTGKKDFQEMQSARDELVLKQEALYEYLKQNNISTPKELTASDGSQDGKKT